ncbi:DUF4442 domain-containing protein [Flocculibacter collagenilyticus]|uniref:DUF4442 domain-containing protein n=1 Tax=Flocculibacter collagenilyticus TaxID=2744479 RepID=UPI001F3EA33F|nr:DUF4442 domain-containing protein [Flocculibacter collagenilyticus]
MIKKNPEVRPVMKAINKLGKIVNTVNRFSPKIRSKALSFLFSRTIKFAGTAGVRVQTLEEGQSVLHLANKKKVQNHIGSVHAAGTALLGESATGFLAGLHIPDSRIPLLKNMNIDYVKRSTGNLTAKATLSQEQVDYIRNTEKGEIDVPVIITDEVGVEPVKCTYTWAWVPKKRK